MRSIVPWLACLLCCGACAPDSQREVDAGPVSTDTGVDAGRVERADARSEAVDAGNEAADAGSVADAGNEAADAGHEADAGAEAADAGAEAIDAGSEAPDAGSEPIDAGSEPIDAGAGHAPFFVFLTGHPISPRFPGDISVLVQDDDGPLDVIGGEVRDPAGRLIGTLIVGPPHDTWRASLSMPLSWEMLAALAPITFAPPRGSLDVIVTVWDRAGARADAQFGVPLRCAPPSLGACASVCVALDTDQNCGACGQSCGGTSHCVAGACAP